MMLPEIVFTARVHSTTRGYVFSLSTMGGCTRARDGVSPPPIQGWGTPVPAGLDSRASTCYAVGATPVAFTQEDFLVSGIFEENIWTKHRWLGVPFRNPGSTPANYISFSSVKEFSRVNFHTKKKIQ